MTRKKALVVDDEADVLLSVRLALETEGLETVTASNGPDALEAALEHAPDVIVLDVMMPQMDGFEVLERLKADKRTRDIPVIMLTVARDRERIKHALDKGVVEYVFKPYELDELLASVSRALEGAA